MVFKAFYLKHKPFFSAVPRLASQCVLAKHDGGLLVLFNANICVFQWVCIDEYMNCVVSNPLSLLACLHAVPYQMQTETKVMEKNSHTHTHTSVRFSQKTFSSPLLFVFSALIPLSFLPDLKSLAFLLFRLLNPLLYSSLVFSCLPHDDSPPTPYRSLFCSGRWKSPGSGLSCPFKVLCLMPPHVTHVQLPSCCHSTTQHQNHFV